MAQIESYGSTCSVLPAEIAHYDPSGSAETPFLINDVHQFTPPSKTMPFESYNQELSHTNTVHNERIDMNQMQNLHAELDRGALYMPAPTSTIVPQTPTPKSKICIPSEITPTKPMSMDTLDPLTPTANLKILLSAASPEIRNREREKLLQLERAVLSQYMCTTESLKGDMGSDGSLDQDEEVRTTEKTQVPTSRKEKSLGLLCQRFLDLFPLTPAVYENVEICLDNVASTLGVERRRIYDIVNVLESVEMVSRVAKNKYSWHGKTNIKNTLSKLKALAIQQGMQEQIEEARQVEMNTQLGIKLEPAKDKKKETNHINEKSLGIMSQRFLMLFLASAPKTVNLDISAKILIGDVSADKKESAKYKTKIRRLYDIANILTSLDLICKVHVTEVRGRKPAFQYVGPELDDLPAFTECSQDACPRPSSKHSLLDCVNHPQVSQMISSNLVPPTQHGMQNSILGQTLLNANSSSNDDNGYVLQRPKALSKRPISRHNSFEQMCEVVEQERNKLYFESKKAEANRTKTILPKKNKASSKKPNIVIVKPPSQVQKEIKTEPPSSIGQITIKKEVDKNMNIQATGHKATVVTLTKEQLDAVIKSLSNQNNTKENDRCESNAINGLVSVLSKMRERNGNEGVNDIAVKSLKRAASFEGNPPVKKIARKELNFKRHASMGFPVQASNSNVTIFSASTLSADAEVESITEGTHQNTKPVKRPSPLRSLKFEEGVSPPTGQLPGHVTPPGQEVLHMSKLDYELASPLNQDEDTMEAPEVSPELNTPVIAGVNDSILTPVSSSTPMSPFVSEFINTPVSAFSAESLATSSEAHSGSLPKLVQIQGTPDSLPPKVISLKPKFKSGSMTFNSSSICPLQPSSTNDISRPRIASLINSQSKDFEITPTTSRPTKCIKPSSNNIVNLKSVFGGSNNGISSPNGIHFVSPQFSLAANSSIKRVVIPSETNITLSNTFVQPAEGLHTPQYVNGIILPTENLNTPQGEGTRLVATPGSFFTTPEVPVTSISQVPIIINSNSAFHSFSNDSKQQVTIARRLALDKDIK